MSLKQNFPVLRIITLLKRIAVSICFCPLDTQYASTAQFFSCFQALVKTVEESGLDIPEEFKDIMEEFSMASDQVLKTVKCSGAYIKPNQNKF